MFKVLLLTVCCLAGCQARFVHSSELRRTLLNHGVPHSQLDTWECIVEHESNSNTKAFNHVTGHHGLFQISERYWCSTHGRGKGCNVSCDEMKSDDINAAIMCALHVQKVLGFRAWAAYNSHCKPMRVDHHVVGLGHTSHTPLHAVFYFGLSFLWSVYAMVV